MNKWQYDYCYSPIGGVLSSFLDERGREGWVLVAVRKSGNVFEHLFKRCADSKPVTYFLRTSPTGGTLNVFELEDLGRHGWELTTLIKIGNVDWHVFMREVGLYDLP